MAIDDFSIYDGPVSVNNVNGNELSFSIYPNPTKGEFTLVAPKSNESINVEILDTKGQLIYNKVMTAASARINTIDLNTIAKGVYFVKISNEDSSKVEKLIIQ
ncbi:MAG: T9SS type A sorting domain-containing protein [Flavobacteriales bacterium]|nr:T9SS type A sorting domain-containing protein [Flavobacteriales bacterium]